MQKRLETTRGRGELLFDKFKRFFAELDRGIKNLNLKRKLRKREHNFYVETFQA